jgi:phosphatidylserine/phosphatidylglycerophosphate/cardiolipin synthase-like enzyme
VCEWSAGLDPDNKEQSIYNAYISAIESAEHFIYIGSLFFLTGLRM